MDILKVLTRSTNLNKKASAQRDTHRRELPSSGAPSHPQALAESDSTGTFQVKKGTKRKRGGSAKEGGSNGVPNFFSLPHNDIKEAGYSTDEELADEPDVIPVETISHPHVDSQIGLAERKDLLRKHKLKIHTVKRTLRDKSGKVKKSKKSKRETKLSYTTIFDPLYPEPIQTFQQLKSTRLSKRLLRNLEDQGYTVPTEVQMASLGIILSKENGQPQMLEAESMNIDLMTVAPTGSGKTLAFLIPVMNDLLAGRAAQSKNSDTERKTGSRYTRAIILAPTHELVDQIVNEARKLSEGTGLKATALQKGVHLCQDEAASDLDGLVKSDIVVSTPMLLANSLEVDDDEHAQQDLPCVSHIVFDEADVLLDPMFRDQTMRVWSACTSSTLRTSFWSATMGASIEDVAINTIYNRLDKQAAGSQKPHQLVRIIAGLKDSAIPNVKHHLTYAATEQGKLLAVRQLLHPSTNSSSSDPIVRPPFLVFTQTIPRAVALHSELLYDIPIEAGGASRIAVLHSDLSLSSRSDIMARFRKGEIWVLITTDLLSRGVDFRGVNGVINYDIPSSGAGYVHRAGRTGRAGREGGVCVTLYSKEDIPYVKNIANVIAAAEKMRGKRLGEDGTAMPQWLLDSLPDLSKEMKKELKKKGVAARRSGKGKEDGKGKMRISTKSGYERKLENRRKGAKMSSARAEQQEDDTHDKADKADDFGGFDD